MALVLADHRAKEKPAYAEYGGDPINMRYKLGVLTPTWASELNIANTQNAEEFVEKICELITWWDLSDRPAILEEGLKAATGSIVRLPDDKRTGKAYKVVEFEPHRIKRPRQGGGVDYVDQEFGLAGELPEEIPDVGRWTCGQLTLEVLPDVSDGDTFSVPLTPFHVGQVPGPILGECIGGVMNAANTGVDEQKSA